MGVKETLLARQEVADVLACKDRKLLLIDMNDARIPASIIDLLEFNASHYDVLPKGTRIAARFDTHTQLRVKRGGQEKYPINTQNRM